MNDLWWLSFTDPRRPSGDQFLGVIVTRAETLEDAITGTWLLGINPGGQILTIGPWPPGTFAPEWQDRLLTKEELRNIPEPAWLKDQALTITFRAGDLHNRAGRRPDLFLPIRAPHDQGHIIHIWIAGYRQPGPHHITRARFDHPRRRYREHHRSSRSVGHYPALLAQYRDRIPYGLPGYSVFSR